MLALNILYFIDSNIVGFMAVPGETRCQDQAGLRKSHVSTSGVLTKRSHATFVASMPRSRAVKRHVASDAAHDALLLLASRMIARITRLSVDIGQLKTVVRYSNMSPGA